MENKIVYKYYPDERMCVLCIEEDGVLTKYAKFISEECAEEFMEKLRGMFFDYKIGMG